MGVALLAAGAMAAPATLDSCNPGSFQTVLEAGDTASDARAYWLNRQLLQWPGKPANGNYRLYYPHNGTLQFKPGSKIGGDYGVLTLHPAAADAAARARFGFIAPGAVLRLEAADGQQLSSLLRRQVLLVQENAAGEVQDATNLQLAGALDDLYASAAAVKDLGVNIDSAGQPATGFKLWAPTAQNVAVCSYASSTGRAGAIAAMQFMPDTGVWQLQLPQRQSGRYYNYVVDVYVPGRGLVRNLVSDPYSVSLSADSRRSYIASLDAPALKPAGWDAQALPSSVKHQTDMAVYELHVRDFSINDASVRPAHRGKYLAFTERASRGMRHLRALRQAGLTDIHLLPVFDIASVPETGCRTPKISGGAVSGRQQALAMAHAADDCFNWGYDPYHYNAPEGSYASDAADGARRILEFRQMVLALHKAGLRVGMDVVYNHTMYAGQHEKSVLDRIVPGYYHRLNAAGAVEQSTCQDCGNTATENRMMAKLMTDSVALWAQAYKIDSFRFDLMGHQPRAAMEQVQARLKAESGRDIQLIGEGWDFGEVAHGARFVQASQLALNGSHIGTFSDRGRDAVRGGGQGDSAEGIVKNQGYINGLVYAPNALADKNRPPSDLLRAADMVRVGLAGSIRDYPLQTWQDKIQTLQEIDYGGQPAGYASQPSEVVNYVENHDNQTLFDINAYRLPADTGKADRVRVQALGLAITALSQGVAYFHAGSDILRSKSLDSNSYNSGDWFNRLDWSYNDNYFATGLPQKPDNAQFYPYIKPLLANPDIKPGRREILMSRDMFRDLLRIRASSSLFRLNSAAEIRQRLHFYNTGARQNPLLIAAALDGAGYPGAGFRSLIYFINVGTTAQQLLIPEQSERAYVLHPVHLRAGAGDRRIAGAARYDRASGRFVIPARSSVVFVER
ncbi:MAG: DUF3372 domain-containing protein [Burkholderiales bacterium]|nr:DUF3372 domain-containing protein [Burkholderiales bacterium]